jgi:hypothetical protein
MLATLLRAWRASYARNNIFLNIIAGVIIVFVIYIIVVIITLSRRLTQMFSRSLNPPSRGTSKASLRLQNMRIVRCFTFLSITRHDQAGSVVLRGAHAIRLIFHSDFSRRTANAKMRGIFKRQEN